MMPDGGSDNNSNNNSWREASLTGMTALRDR